jgi:hypothetical protein
MQDLFRALNQIFAKFFKILQLNALIVIMAVFIIKAWIYVM